MSDSERTSNLTRRRFLAGTACVANALVVFGGPASAQSQAGKGRTFRPEVHGYGFRNWSTENAYFDKPSKPDKGSVTDLIADEWRAQAKSVLSLDVTRLPERTIEVIGEQTRNAVVQRAGTNGHCYGMVLGAQEYFSEPETIPVDRETASEIDSPTVPVESPEAPVYEDIVNLQATQYLRFRAWLGRRALFYRDRIDTRAVLRDIRAAIEKFGTAAIILYNDSEFTHQVLVYDVTELGNSIVLSIYDPNKAAPAYGRKTRKLRFKLGNGSATMEPYRRYTGVLYNRFDRIELATGRSNASPLDHLSVGGATVEKSLFPLVFVNVDTEDTAISMVGPDGTEGTRIRGANMDPSRGDPARILSHYGAPPGTYTIRVFGVSTTDYELEAVVTGSEETQVDATLESSIESGGLHEYELEVPADGEGTLRLRDGGSLQPGVVGAAAAIGGLGAGALGYRAVQRRGGSDSGQEGA